MRLVAIHLAILSLFTSHAVAQNKKEASGKKAEFKVDPISLERVDKDMRFLASDELEGRGVQTDGIRKAAEYIRSEFKRLGLKSGVADGSYYQKFNVPLREKKPSMPNDVLVLRGPGGKELKVTSGKTYQPIQFGGDGKAKAELIFAGYGISAAKQKYDDYKGVDVKGKVVVIIRREPQQDDDKSVFNGKAVTNHSYIMTKIMNAKQKGAAAVLLVNDPRSAETDKKDTLVASAQFQQGFNTPKRLPFAQLKISVLDQMLAQSPVKDSEGHDLKSVAEIEKHINDHMQPLTQSLKGWSAEMHFTFKTPQVQAENVVGVIEGEGPLADETIVIGAHYDHIGYGGYGSLAPNKKGQIHNGADDNATGTAAVIELARRFATRKQKPKRRLVFIAFSGEERGLVGSRHYVSKPLFPIKNTVTMINYDMIGMLANNRLFAAGTASSSSFAGPLDDASKATKLEVRKPRRTPTSDQFWFQQRKVPVVFFYTGGSKVYHTPDDDYERLNVPGMVRVIDISEKFIEGVANLDERPKFIAPAVARRTPQRRRPYLGIAPDIGASSSDGIVVDDVTANSPAAKAGFKPGDTIVKLGDFDVTDLDSLTKALDEYKPKQKIKIVVTRKKEKKTLEVTLAEPR